MASNPDVPPFIGYVETTVNALRLIHAARQGVIPRITRRLNDSERRSMIKSGAVFVFSVEESGIKRWTDGLLWSPSRIVGNFLVYREINERTSSRGNHKKPYPTNDPTSRSLARRSSPEQVGFKCSPPAHGNDQGTFKPGGLIKKTITVTIEDSDLHLISYYTSEDIRSGKLKRPSSRSDIMSLHMPPHIFRLTNFRVPPKVEIGPDGKPRLVCEAEDLELVECKVEDPIYQIPDSPTSWGNPNSPSSPVESSFSPTSLISVGSHYQVGSYGRSQGNTDSRWGVAHGNDLPTHWPPSSTVSSSSTLPRRRDSNVLQDSWPSIQTQSHRWQDSSHNTPSHNSNASLYLERSRVRPAHPYDDTANLRREHEGMLPSVNRYGGRESSSQRTPWHQRESSHTSSGRDRRGVGSSQSTSFTPSPTLSFNSQGYHTAPAYTSAWTSSGDSNMIGTPTLHSISTYAQPNYSSGASTLSSPEDFGNVVDDYGDA